MGYDMEEFTDVEFTKNLNGYNKKEVEQFRAKVVVELENRERENKELQRLNQCYLEKIEYYKSLEATMQNSIKIAQRTLTFSQSQSERAKTHADKEAETIVKNANEQAKAILHQTYEKNERLIKEYNQYCDEFETFKLRVANFIETQKNVFSTSPEKLELSPLDLRSFEEYVLKNIADEKPVEKNDFDMEDFEVDDEGFGEIQESDQLHSDSDDHGVKG